MFYRFLFLTTTAAFMALNAHAQQFEALSGSSILVCKDRQCVPTSDQMGRDYLVNQVNELLSNNSGKEVRICEASPNDFTCLKQDVSFPISSQTIQTVAHLPSAQIIDVKPVKEGAGLDLIIDYHMRAGNTFPNCQTSLSRIGVASAADAKMMSPKFNCRLTETGKTTFSLVYDVNYIDLDRGVIGAFYSAAANNALHGSQNGYALMALEKGVEMEPGETFPYVAQLEAVLNGTMPAINDPDMLEKMGAFWLKPTPFLNLSTPQFAPNNCVEFQGGCSAEMLNEPAKAVPPAAEKIAQLTPPGVPATVGLIQQKITFENPSAAAGTENTASASKQMIQNGEKEYLSLKQFEATGKPQTATQQIVPVQGASQVVQQPAVQQQVIQQPAPAAMPQQQNPAAVQIIPQAGVTLSNEERAYIEKLAQQSENQPLPSDIDAQSDLSAIAGVTVPAAEVPSSAQPAFAPSAIAGVTVPAAEVPSSAQPAFAPAVQQPQVIQQPTQQQAIPVITPAGQKQQELPIVNVSTVPQNTVVIKPTAAPVKDKEDDSSMWKRFKKGVSDFFYL